jgi:hypothetical protein
MITDKFLALVFDDAIAVARRRAYTLEIEDLDPATRISDASRSLKLSGNETDARSLNAKHVRQKLLR